MIANQPAELYLPSLPDNHIDLVLTSPPYDGLREYNGFSFDFETIARELFRTVKRGGVVVWVVGDQVVNGSETGTSFRQALGMMAAGFRLHDTMIYKKKNFVPQTHNRYEQCFEYMFVFSKGRPKTFNPILVPTVGGGKPASLKKRGVKVKEAALRTRDTTIVYKDKKIHINIFEYPTGQDQAGHPAAFPERLAADQISTWSNPGDVVCDPFSGSATTAKVALQLGRQAIGSEISTEYWELGNRRIAKVLDNPTLF